MREKKRNKYFLREKELIRLENESNELLEQIRNQSLIKLDKPIPHGWVARWDLRDDIKRREDSWVYYQILNLVGVSIWSRRKDFKYKERKTKKYITQFPGMRKIKFDVYDNLHPSVKKHFHLSYNKNPFIKEYWCDVTYEFVVKIKRDYITHYREHDEVLKQRDSEIDDKISELRYKIGWGRYYKAPNWYNRTILRAAKNKDKSKLTKLKNSYNYCDRDSLDIDTENIFNELEIRKCWW